MSRPVTPRADVALIAGYHSPQLDVEVRLNTNESPEPPPDGFTTALAGALGDVAWNRYPDRAATELRARIAAFHGVEPAQVFCANGSNEVLQSVLLAYGGPGRRALVWEPTYALHSHIAHVVGTGVVVEERAPDFTIEELRLVVAKVGGGELGQPDAHLHGFALGGSRGFDELGDSVGGGAREREVGLRRGVGAGFAGTPFSGYNHGRSYFDAGQ